MRPKDPLEYLRKLRFHRGIAGPAPTASTAERGRPGRVVDIFTDGACSGNPGPGGWGAILRYRGRRAGALGGEPGTTNNRMELMAAIAALEALKRPCRVRLHTDSRYVRDGITTWLHAGSGGTGAPPTRSRSRTSICGSGSRPPTSRTRSNGIWVRGHAGHPENERADALARAAISRPPRPAPAASPH